MLPFTKRPGRGDDRDVAKDDLLKSTGSVPASNVKLSSPPPGFARRPEPSLVDDEMATSIMQSRSFTGPILPANTIRPAAGRPATVPPPAARSRTVSVRPPPQSVRPPPSSRDGGRIDEDDDDDGRTVVRGAPKIVKRSPAKKLQSASRSTTPVRKTEPGGPNRRNLLPGPPTNLLEDRSDFEDRATQHSGVGAHAQYTSEGAPQTHRSTSMDVPASYPSAPYGHGPAAHASSVSRPVDHLGRVGATHAPPYGATPLSPEAPAVPAPGASMPAHFMTAQAPYSDPPGTAVTSSHRVVGRPATSWALALLACGLFVGVAAVTVMQTNTSVADTTASFVDPSHGSPNANAVQSPPSSSTPAPEVTPSTPAVTPSANPALGGSLAPSGLTQPISASDPRQPLAGQPLADPGAPTSSGSVVAGFAPVTVASSAVARRPPSVTKAPPPPAPAAAPRATTKVATASSDEEPPKKDPKPSKPTSKKGGDTAADDETKKALEALQKAQLESASSFGKE